MKKVPRQFCPLVVTLWLDLLYDLNVNDMRESETQSAMPSMFILRIKQRT